MQVLSPVALQRAEVIGISEFASELFKKFPVSIARRGAVALFEVLTQMRLHAIVVDQRVIHVEEEDDVGRLAHSVPADLTRRFTSSCPCLAVPWRLRSHAAVRSRIFARVL